MNKPDFTDWKSQPIFISSTFTDMMAERDALRDFVFPELEERLRERKIRLEAIDLRWGVETSNEKEQKTKELLVLKVCLDEIDRSMPFFIGIIGERYGWVPPEERLLKAEQEKGFKSEIKNKSVTALEIEYGVLADSEQLKRSFFFFREALPFEKIPSDIKTKYSDVYIKGIDKDFAKNRLEKFKELIVSKVGKNKVFTYSVKWDEKYNKVTELDDFKQKVLAVLWNEIDEQTKIEEDNRPHSWQDEERIYLDEFVNERTVSFSGRGNIINKLKLFAWAESGFDNWALCLSGESGGGKSALFAKVYKELKSKNDILVLGHAAGISLRSNSLNNMLTLWIEELAKELQKDISEQLKEALKFEDLKKLFSELLAQVAINKRVVVLVDALNQFENTDHAKHVNWLPEIIPANSKFIFTAITGEETENLSKRDGIVIEELAPINKADAEDIITIICNRYHKELNQQVINKLLDKKKKDGTFAYNNALWLTMAIDEFLLLDEDDFNRMKGLEGNAEQKLLQLLLNTANELPADIPGMYNYVFERAGIFGKEFANSILSYIGISRNGLRESDLKQLITNYTNAKWEPLNFATFRRYLRSHLVRKGEIGLWDFRHMQVRESLKNSLLADEKKVKRLHSNLAEHLEKLHGDDSLYLSEIMWHLFKCDNKIKAAEIYGSNWADNYKTESYSITLKDILLKDEKNANWVVSLTQLPQTTNSNKGSIINNFLFCLDKKIANYIALPPRLYILQKINISAKQLSKQNPASDEYLRYVIVSFDSLGDIYKETGVIKSAQNSYENALNITKELWQRNQNEQNTRDLSVLYDKIGNLYLRDKDAEKSKNYFQNSLNLREQLWKKNPKSELYLSDLSVSFDRMGDVYRIKGETGNAQKNYEISMKIREDLRKINPESDQYARDLTISYDKIGKLFEINREIKNAQPIYKSALSIRKELLNRNPESQDYAWILAISYDKNGHIHIELGEIKEARDKYELALKIRETLLKRNPESVKYIRSLTVSYNNIGDTYKLQGENKTALTYYRNSLDITKELLAQNPKTILYLRDMSVPYDNIGDIYKAMGNTKDAMINYLQALKISEQLVEQNPDSAEDKRDVQVSYRKIGDLLAFIENNTHEPKQSYTANDIKELEKELEIQMTNYEDNPEDNDLKKSLAKSFEKLGIAYQSVGNLDLALRSFKLRNEIVGDFFKSNPLNANNAQELAVSLFQLGSVYQQLKQIKDSVNHYTFSMKIFQKLYADTKIEAYKTYYENIKQMLNNLNTQHPEI